MYRAALYVTVHEYFQIIGGVERYEAVQALVTVHTALSSRDWEVVGTRCHKT
jgi:hypothetical protein